MTDVLSGVSAGSVQAKGASPGHADDIDHRAELHDVDRLDEHALSREWIIGERKGRQRRRQAGRAMLPAASRAVTVSTFGPIWRATPLAVQLVVLAAVPLAPPTAQSRDLRHPDVVARGPADASGGSWSYCRTRSRWAR